MAPHVKVGDYVLKQKIGEGAFAEVRLAEHDKTGQEYAVKVLNKASFPRADFEKEVKREIKIMRYLRHPSIVSIHAVLVTDTKMYLVMELVRGGELYDEIVTKKKIDEKTSRKYFQQLVDAMVYCHERGVVHRDLKPENLLLTHDGNLKITDFGMSWMKETIDPEHNAKKLLQTQCGTPKYMAPEIIVRSSEGYDGEKLDAWECGMVLYALLAGYLPFNGEDDNVVFHQILRGKLRFPSHFSLGARDLLAKLLEKDPEKRSYLADIRKHPWFLVGYIETPLKRGLSDKRRKPSKLGHITGEKEKLGTNFKHGKSKSAKFKSSLSGKIREGELILEATPGVADNASTKPLVKISVASSKSATIRISPPDAGLESANIDENADAEDIGGPEVKPRSDPVDSTAVPRLNLAEHGPKATTLESGGEEEESPMSMRDRIKSPISSIFRSIRSGHDVSGAQSERANWEKASWFAQENEVTAEDQQPTPMSDCSFNVLESLLSEDNGAESRVASMKHRMTKLFGKKDSNRT